MTASSDSSVSPLLPHRVHVDLGPRAYDVLIGRGLLDHAMDLIREIARAPFEIITDETVGPLFASRLEQKSSESSHKGTLFAIPRGEKSKSLKVMTDLLSFLAEKKVPRSATIIGLGGGVVGDLAGFVAATYLRGVAFVQIPTTLLAMVDSSVGGKTGVNLPEGKNLVGAFHQPRLVIADLATLDTLPPREFSAGMAEVIKYGMIADPELFHLVATGLPPNHPELARVIARCVEIKARIVERDEFETGSERALLNFGHTIGHAIEKATGYNTYLHGEALALGLRAATWLSIQVLGLAPETLPALERALSANGLPTFLKFSRVGAEPIRAALGNDKKVAADGRNRWVLLPFLGHATSGHEITPDLVEEAITLLYQAPE